MSPATNVGVFFFFLTAAVCQKDTSESYKWTAPCFVLCSKWTHCTWKPECCLSIDLFSFSGLSKQANNDVDILVSVTKDVLGCLFVEKPETDVSYPIMCLILCYRVPFRYAPINLPMTMSFSQINYLEIK